MAIDLGRYDNKLCTGRRFIDLWNEAKDNDATRKDVALVLCEENGLDEEEAEGGGKAYSAIGSILQKMKKDGIVVPALKSGKRGRQKAEPLSDDAKAEIQALFSNEETNEEN